MRHSQNTPELNFRRAERGASTVKFLIVSALLIAGLYSAYQYAPVVYYASTFKVFMQDKVDQAVALGKKSDWVEQQIRTSAPDYQLPKDAVIKVQTMGDRLAARVQYTRTVPLVGFNYTYKFDHTVQSTPLFSGQ